MTNYKQYAKIICPNCRLDTKYLTRDEYNRQMNKPDYTWQCPDCGSYGCAFDDEYFEKNLGLDTK